MATTSLSSCRKDSVPSTSAMVDPVVLVLRRVTIAGTPRFHFAADEVFFRCVASFTAFTVGLRVKRTHRVIAKN
jgi:hypothetical protein